MNEIKLVSDLRQLETLVRSIGDCEWVGMDTEFLRIKTYYPLLCLLQIHSEMGSFCVDALKIKRLDCLIPLFANPLVIKIIHSCRQDLEALELGVDKLVAGLFDTQIAAAFCGYGDQVSYASLVRDLCGVVLNKDQTRTDWSRRPLTIRQLQYAMDDVRYLNEIRTALTKQLNQPQHFEWFQTECNETATNRNYIIHPEDAWKRLKGFYQLPANSQGIARELAAWRESRAQKSNRPREWVLSTQTLISICITRPKNLSQLSRISDISQGLVRNSGLSILSVLNKFPAPAGDRELSVRNRVERLTVEQKKSVNMAMKLLKEIAQKERIGQGLLANRSDIEAMVQGEKDIKILTGWRYELFGKRLLEDVS